jgi:hypothetical protein
MARWVVSLFTRRAPAGALRTRLAKMIPLSRLSFSFFVRLGTTACVREDDENVDEDHRDRCDRREPACDRPSPRSEVRRGRCKAVHSLWESIPCAHDVERNEASRTSARCERPLRRSHRGQRRTRGVHARTVCCRRRSRGLSRPSDAQSRVDVVCTRRARHLIRAVERMLALPSTLPQLASANVARRNPDGALRRRELPAERARNGSTTSTGRGGADPG